MSEAQAYYEAFQTGYWANQDPNQCKCHGHGWALSEVDTWHQCPIHFKGQEHPEVAASRAEYEWEHNQENTTRKACGNEVPFIDKLDTGAGCDNEDEIPF